MLVAYYLSFDFAVDSNEMFALNFRNDFVLINNIESERILLLFMLD